MRTKVPIHISSGRKMKDVSPYPRETASDYGWTVAPVQEEVTEKLQYLLRRWFSKVAQIIFLNYIKTAISHFNFSVAINMNLYMTLY